MVNYTAPMPARVTGPTPDGHIVLLQAVYDALDELRTKGAALKAADLTDTTTVGRALMTATDAAAARAATGAGTSNLALGTSAGSAAAGNDPRLSDARAPLAHSHAVADLSDATALGRSLVTAPDAAAARAVTGAGTSNLALGSTASTAAAGNDPRLSDARTPLAHSHVATDVSDATAVGRAVMTAASPAAARTATGAAASDGGWTIVGTTAGAYPANRPTGAGRVWFDDANVTPPGWAAERDRWSAV